MEIHLFVIECKGVNFFLYVDIFNDTFFKNRLESIFQAPLFRFLSATFAPEINKPTKK